MSGMAHFFMSVCGSKFHERLAHFFIDIYTVHFQAVGVMKPEEQKNFIEKYIKGIELITDTDGNLSVKLLIDN